MDKFLIKMNQKIMANMSCRNRFHSDNDELYVMKRRIYGEEKCSPIKPKQNSINI
jgi:hypothetical protein